MRRDDQAVGLSITTALDQQKVIAAGGMDWLEVTVFGCYDWRKQERMNRMLEKAKEAAKGNEEGAKIVVDGHPFHVKPYGKNWGAGHLHFVFEYSGCMIGYRATIEESYRDRIPSAWVQIGSEVLMLHQWNAWHNVRAMLRELFGLEVRDTCVSRVDVCLDLPGQVAEPIVDAIGNASQRICSARQRAQYQTGDRRHAARIGSTGRLCMTAYCKAQELRDKPNPTKHAIVQKQRWNDQDQQHATRIEYRVRREALAERYNIRTVEDLQKSMGSMVHDLTHEWIRLVDYYDGSNPDRARTSEVWRSVQDGFRSWAGSPDYSCPKPEECAPSIDRLLRQGLGCLETALSLVAENDIFGLDEFLGELLYMVEGAAKESAARVRKKKSVLEAKGKRKVHKLYALERQERIRKELEAVLFFEEIAAKRGSSKLQRAA